MVTTGFSQFRKDSSCTGSIIGVVRDSTHNYVMQSATLAVYRVKDSTLISYQLSNNFGEFNFKELPTEALLRIVASYIGYKNVDRKFTIPAKENNLNLHHLNMDRMMEGDNEDTGLEDVIVKSIPPVQMNGDTLEFNADAFKLDPNAVTEDFLRELPGVVIWGDGSITVNGREISSVLVNGKPFFGGDTKVATQNLPKAAVDKIQVYQQNRNESNPLDSITEINIKLKKGKEVGRFGKLAGGVGTDKHYEADANINFFTNRTQLGIVGGINDINKIAMDVNTLMRNSTYKGVGASVEYQPDFRLPGLNLTRSGGFTFQHDYIEHPDYYQNNRLTSNYFIRSGIGRQSTETQLITSLGTDSIQTRQLTSQDKTTFTPQQFSAKYEKKKDDYAYHIGMELKSLQTDNNSQSSSTLYTSYSADQSRNDAQNASHSKSQGATFYANVHHNNENFAKGMLAHGWELNYNLKLDNSDSRNHKQTQFISLENPNQNQFIDRKYNNTSNGINQYVGLSYGGLSKWIMPRWLSSINSTFKNSLRVRSHTQDRSVLDKDTFSGVFSINHRLSGTSKYTEVDERPALEFSKSINKSLANRYNKNLTFTAQAQEQFFYRRNNSVHEFQNITQNFKRFLPSANIIYQNNQYGAFMDNYSLQFTTAATFANLDQLVPLVDSSNLYYIRQGNLHLRPSYTKTLRFGFNHNSESSKNPFNYNVGISLGQVDNYFADSSVTDSLGRSTHYSVNLDGYRYINGNVSLNKAFKFKGHQLLLSYDGSMNISRNPAYINKVFNYSKTASNNQSLRLNYNMKDRVAINLMQSYAMYRSEQDGANNYIFKNTTSQTSLSISLKCAQRFTMGSNISYNHTTSSGADPTNFTIWNAQAYYRFLKGNNLEIKVAALDLLHQNTSVVNFGHNNVISKGTVQVLQNYYMITLSFFPRRFGKKK